MSLSIPLTSSHPHHTSNRLFGSEPDNKRWWILFAFSLYNASVALAWLTYGSVSGTSMEYFKINVNELLLFSDALLYMYFLLSYLGCYLAHKMFRNFMITCTILAATGGWIRYFAGSNYPIALFGQLVIATVYAPSFGFATLLPDRWFPVKERFVVTTISVYSSYMGWALGYIIPCVIVGDDVNKMESNLFFQAILMSIPFLVGVFVIQDRPRIPPSYSAMVKINDHSTFIEEMKVLIRMPRFLINSLIFGLVLGVSYSVSTVSAIFMEPLNLSYLDQGIIGFSYVASGLVAGIVGSIWLEKQDFKNYDMMVRSLLTLSLASLTVLGIVFLFIENPGMFVILLCNVVLGVGLIGFTPFICASVIESTFPVHESMSTNAMFMVTQLFSVITGHLSTSEFVGKGGFLLLAAIILPCWIYGMFFHKTEYKKQGADDQNKEINREMEEFIARTHDEADETTNRRTVH